MIQTVSAPSSGIRDYRAVFDRTVEQYDSSTFRVFAPLSDLPAISIPYSAAYPALSLSCNTSTPITVGTDDQYGWLSDVRVTIYLKFNDTLLAFPDRAGSFNTFWVNQTVGGLFEFWIEIVGVYNHVSAAPVDSATLHIASGFTLSVYRSGAGVSPDMAITARLVQALTRDIVSALNGGANPPSYNDDSIGNASDDLGTADKELNAETDKLITFSDGVSDYDFTWIPSSVQTIDSAFRLFQPLFTALLSPFVFRALFSLILIFVVFVSFLRRI